MQGFWWQKPLMRNQAAGSLDRQGFQERKMMAKITLFGKKNIHKVLNEDRVNYFFTFSLEGRPGYLASSGKYMPIQLFIVRSDQSRDNLGLIVVAASCSV